MNNSERIAEIVKELQAGDSSNFSEFYQLTLGSAMAVTVKYLKHEEDRQDVLQEAYSSVLQKIRTIEKPESFQSFLNQVVARNCLNLLRRSDPVQFSELTVEEGEADIDFEDERPSFQPEKIVDMKTVSEAVNEVMDMLPTFQRDALWMHYGQDIPVKDLAEAAGVSENTIKSRLKQGRDKLTNMKVEFRRRGIEVSGVTIAVLLYTIFARDTEVKAEELAADAEFMKMSSDLWKKIEKEGKPGSPASEHPHIENPAGDTAAETAGAKTAGTVSAGTALKAGLGLGAKIAIAAAVGAGAAGGIAAVHVANSGRNYDIAAEVTTLPSESATVSEEASPTPSEETEVLSERDAAMIAEYRNFLSQTSLRAPFASNTAPTGYYMYTLVQMEQDDGPVLLLAQGEDSGMYCVRFYYYTEEDGLMYASFQIMIGAAGTGGVRSSLEIAPDGYSLRQAEWLSTETTAYVTIYRKEGDTIYPEDGTDFDYQEDGFPQDGETIQWYTSTDSRALDSWPETVEATGENGFPDDQCFSACNVPAEQTQESTENQSYGMTGTYQSASGDTLVIVDHGNYSITVNGMDMSVKGSDGWYWFPDGSARYLFEDYTQTPHPIHVMDDNTGNETVYYKVE